MPTFKTTFMPSVSTRILYVCISLLSLCCILSISLSPLEAKTNHLNSQSATAGDLSQWPQYSILYERLLLLERQGKFVEALRVIPEVYGAEIPVDSFYITLENKRLQLLEMVSQKEISFSVGNDIYTCSGIRQLFRILYLNKSNSYRQMVVIPGELDVKRFCYFMIIEGWNQKVAAFQFDTQSSLVGADPWLVSAALFISRKQKSQTITPQDIINRWQSRPDLWDEECTRQALLFLAQFDSAKIKALEITNEDIRLQVEKLFPVSKDHSYIAPLMFSAVGEDVTYSSTFIGTIVQMKNKKNVNGVVKRWAGDTNQAS